MGRSLRARLLLGFLLVVGAALGTVALAVLLVGPGYFAEAMGHAPGDPAGAAMDEATRLAFVDAMRRALVAATVIAVATATIVSFAIAARISGPISRLAAAAARLARGRYGERVDEEGPEELAAVATSFNEMARSLDETERRRLQLVGDVAHELRTPLTTLDGYIEGLEDGVISPNAQTWHLLRAQTTRLTRLVNDLSELWRAEARQLPLDIATVDAAELARAVAEDFRAQALPRGISIDVHATEARCLADSERLAQILANYLSNAIRHAPDGTAVRVDARRDGSKVILSVADDGPGLAADQLEAVFERFYRVDPARSRAAGGSGIGLAIVRALATAMGGAAWAESEGPGQGTSFLVELPAA